jgi:hypothetical protein
MQAAQTGGIHGVDGCSGGLGPTLAPRGNSSGPRSRTDVRRSRSAFLTEESNVNERVWSEKDLARRAKRRLAVLQHAEEVSGDVAATCRYYGISRAVFYRWKRQIHCQRAGVNEFTGGGYRLRKYPHSLRRQVRRCRCCTNRTPFQAEAEAGHQSKRYPELERCSPAQDQRRQSSMS